MPFNTFSDMDMRPEHIVTMAAALAVIASCSSQWKAGRLKESRSAVNINLGDGIPEEERFVRKQHRDTLEVMDDNGGRLTLMRAVRDEQGGGMVATETLDAAVVTSRFRNIAERGGKISVGFDITVPRDLQYSQWQMRLSPVMYMNGDSLLLEKLFLTGADYRRKQLKGYQQYQKFLDSIIYDTLKFVDARNLEIFLERNIPELYRFKTDSSEVSDTEFLSCYGVNERQAVEHYTNMFAKRRNDRKRSRTGAMFRKYVKAPIVSEGIRLDTIIRNPDGDFVYHYSQTLKATPRLRKIDLVLSGGIYESDRRIYGIPRTPPLTFYISSLSSLADSKEKYLTKVIERRAFANTACYVEFAQGSSVIDTSLGHNAPELARIRENIMELLENRKYVMDSTVISASASPEGGAKANGILAGKRAMAVADFFRDEIRRHRDTLISFVSHSRGENWEMLSYLVDTDSTLSRHDAASFASLMEIEDVDRREQMMGTEPYYRYFREALYPRLRVVRFDFYMHRKGVVKDTVRTTEIDSVYMKGVEALKAQDYETALAVLREYRDVNTALAFLGKDYNASAMAVLKGLEPDAKVCYLMALSCARADNPAAAAEYFLKACRMDRSYIFRGNLDPEIHSLMESYDFENFEQ